MSSYGQSTIGYRILVFVFFIVSIIFGGIALSLYFEQQTPLAETEQAQVVIVTATPSVPTLVPEEDIIAENAQRLDDFKMLRLIFGDAGEYQFSDEDGRPEVLWTPAADQLGAWKTDGEKAFLTRIYAVITDEESDLKETYVFTKTSPKIIFEEDCAVMIGVARLLFRFGDWFMDDYQAVLQPADGICQEAEIKTVSFGEEMDGWILEFYHQDDTETLVTTAFYMPVEGRYIEVLSLVTQHDNAPLCPPLAGEAPCFNTFRTYTLTPGENLGIDDFLVHTRGTHQVEGLVEQIYETTLYRLRGKLYLPVTEE